MLGGKTLSVLLEIHAGQTAGYCLFAFFVSCQLLKVLQSSLKTILLIMHCVHTAHICFKMLLVGQAPSERVAGATET